MLFVSGWLEASGDELLAHRLIQALLLAVPATVALSGSISFVQAAEECRAKPGPTAPSGGRWLYRINRTDHRHCWFLSSKAASTHSQPSRRYRHLAGEPAAARLDQQQSGSDLKARSAPASETDVAEVAEPPTAPQVGAPSVKSSSENLVAHSVPTIVYRLPSPNTQTVSRPTAVAARTVEPQPAGASSTNLVLLAGAAGAALLFAGGTFYFTRQTRRSARTSVDAVRHTNRESAVIGSPVAAKRPLLTTDPADDLKGSLRELKRDLKNASEPSNLRSSRAKGSRSSGAVWLPHSAAWLSRPQVKLRTEPANYQLADA